MDKLIAPARYGDVTWSMTYPIRIVVSWMSATKNVVRNVAVMAIIQCFRDIIAVTLRADKPSCFEVRRQLNQTALKNVPFLWEWWRNLQCQHVIHALIQLIGQFKIRPSDSRSSGRTVPLKTPNVRQLEAMEIAYRKRTKLAHKLTFINHYDWSRCTQTDVRKVALCASISCRWRANNALLSDAELALPALLLLVIMCTCEAVEPGHESSLPLIH